MVLRQPTYRLVVLAYRNDGGASSEPSTSQQGEASAAPDGRPRSHGIELAMYSDIPQCDLELLLPHQRVLMPGLQRGELAMVVGMLLFVGWPLMHSHELTLTSMITLWALGAYTAPHFVRLRLQQDLYQQLLHSYQAAGRLGSHGAALTYALDQAEEQQVLRA